MVHDTNMPIIINASLSTQYYIHIKSRMTRLNRSKDTDCSIPLLRNGAEYSSYTRPTVPSYAYTDRRPAYFKLLYQPST